MQKQKKNLNFLQKINTRFRKKMKYKSYILNYTLNNLIYNLPKIKISLRVTQNNIFFTLIDLKKNETKLISSTGIEKIKTTKKLLKFSTKIILPIFFNKILTLTTNQTTIFIELNCPILIKKRLLKQINKLLNKNILLINTANNKCFNGCKEKKKKRKKLRTNKFRIFK
uniref:Orf168 n=1 Tax=Synura synuroidea TaxID=47573 RepID=Q9MGA4_9STRA|nr:orf168 [Synura synuroidea]AAF36945.1 orf168 [Synura synuroidea]